jgi:hypothetical protein
VPQCEYCRSLKESYTTSFRLYADALRLLEEAVSRPDFPEVYGHAQRTRYLFEYSRDALNKHNAKHHGRGV